jgi:hypothetical protein
MNINFKDEVPWHFLCCPSKHSPFRVCSNHQVAPFVHTRSPHLDPTLFESKSSNEAKHLFQLILQLYSLSHYGCRHLDWLYAGANQTHDVPYKLGWGRKHSLPGQIDRLR